MDGGVGRKGGSNMRDVFALKVKVQRGVFKDPLC